MSTEKQFKNANSNIRLLSFLVIIGVGVGVITSYSDWMRKHPPEFNTLIRGALIFQCVLYPFFFAAAIGLLNWKDWGRSLLVVMFSVNIAFNASIFLWLQYKGQSQASLHTLIPIIVQAYFISVLVGAPAKQLIKHQGNIEAAIADSEEQNS